MKNTITNVTLFLYLSGCLGCATTKSPRYAETPRKDGFSAVWQCVTHEDFGAAVAFVIITSPILVPGLIIEAIQNKFKKSSESQDQPPTKEG